MSLGKEIEIRDELIRIFNEVQGDKVYDFILDVVLKVLESTYGVFCYLNYDRKIVCLSIEKNSWTEHQLPEKAMLLTQDDWLDIWGRSVLEKDTFVSHDPFNMPGSKIIIQNLLDVPISHRKTVLGHILIANKSSNFTDKDTSLLETITNYIFPLLKLRLKQESTQKKLIESKRALKKYREKFDEVDKQIMYQLYLDGKKSPLHMENDVFKANKKKMSHVGIKNRIAKLLDSKTLNIQGNVNFKKIGVKAAFIKFEFENFDFIDDFIEKYTHCPRVFMISKITGQFHIIICVMGMSLAEINDFVNQRILEDKKQIKSSSTVFASELIKPQFFPLKIVGDFYENIYLNKTCKAFSKNLCNGCNILKFDGT